MTFEPSTPVWRYMSFAKLVWMLQNKELWLSSAELLDDKWEVMLDGFQLGSIISNRPPGVSAKAAKEKAGEAIRKLRQMTFISCWTASEHESHALWQIYCPTSEGVAIQTTLGRLRQSVGVPVLEVSYEPPEPSGSIPDSARLVAQKRPMFAYEREVRVVLVRDLSDVGDPSATLIGTGLKWDPETHLENVWVHPEAPYWFMEAVTEAVRLLAPNLSQEGRPSVRWSKMNLSPPL